MGGGGDDSTDVTAGEATVPAGGDLPYDEAYYQANGQYGDRPALRFYVRLVRRYLGAGPYLDFGCGTGHLLRRLSRIGSATGFEISPFSAARDRKSVV